MEKDDRPNDGSKRAENAEEVLRVVRNHFKTTYKAIAENLNVDVRSLQRYTNGSRDFPSEARHAFIHHYLLDPELPYAEQKQLLEKDCDPVPTHFEAAFDLRTYDSVNIAIPNADETDIRIEQANAFRCRACGVIEDLWRPHCRCSAFLHSQVLATAWEAVHKVVDELNATIKKATMQSLGLTIVGLMPLAVLAMAMHSELIASNSEQLANLWAVGLANLVLCLAFAGHISRKEKR